MKHKTAKSRHISAQIQQLPSWNMSQSDPKISSETSSQITNSNYCFKYIKPKSKDQNRIEFGSNCTNIHKYQEDLSRFSGNQLRKIYKSPGKRKSTMTSDDETRLISSIVQVQKVKPCEFDLSERMNKIKFLNRASTSMKLDFDK